MKLILHILCIIGLSMPGIAQTVTVEGAQFFELKDQTKVVVFPAKDCDHCFYYIPSNFHISVNESRQPEVSLLKISETDDAPVTGGLLHVLFVWGFDVAQDAELQQLIQTNADSLGILLGATTVEEDAEAPGIKISGKDALAQTFREGLKSSSGVATTPGGKMAMSFRFDESQMKVLLEALDNPKFKTDSAFEISLVAMVNSEKFARRLHIKQQVKFADLIPLIR